MNGHDGRLPPKPVQVIRPAPTVPTPHGLAGGRGKVPPKPKAKAERPKAVNFDLKALRARLDGA